MLGENMKQKILGIIPLMVVMLFVAFLAVGDYQASAADTANQVVTVTVNPNIAITTATDITMSANDGATATSTNYDVTNVGNVKVHIYVRADNANFAGSDPIPISGYRILNQAGSPVTLTTVNQVLTTTKLDTQKHGNNILTTSQALDIPTGTEAGDYTNSLTYVASTS